MPAWQLLFSTVLGQLIVNVWILCFAGRLVDKMLPMDVGMVWLYDLVWLLVLDIVKMTAEKIWDKYKPYDIEHNPALAAKQQLKRQNSRLNNSLMAGDVAEAKRNSFRKSGRVSVRIEK